MSKCSVQPWAGVSYMLLGKMWTEHMGQWSDVTCPQTAAAQITATLSTSYGWMTFLKASEWSVEFWICRIRLAQKLQYEFYKKQNIHFLKKSFVYPWLFLEKNFFSWLFVCEIRICLYLQGRLRELFKWFEEHPFYILQKTPKLWANLQKGI